MKAMKRILDNLVRRISDAVVPVRRRVRVALEGMNARDRMLLFGMVIAITIVVLGLGTAAMLSRLESAENLLATRRTQLAMVSEMGLSYQDALGKNEELEKKLSAHRDTTLSAFLEKAADKTQIRDNLKQVKERSATITLDLEEKVYAVQLSKVTLEQLANYLYEIETSGYPLLVRNAKIKPKTRAGETLLQVDFDISAFRLLAEEGGEG